MEGKINPPSTPSLFPTFADTEAVPSYNLLPSRTEPGLRSQEVFPHPHKVLTCSTGTDALILL